MSGRAVMLAGLFALLFSCGGPTYIPVAGIVTLDGAPVAGAAITFSPTFPGEASVGVTDKEGRFTIQTAHENVGAIPGKYRVAVFRAEMVPLRKGEKAPPGDIALEGQRMQWIVPQKYSRMESSGLEVEIKSPMPEVKLELSSGK